MKLGNILSQCVCYAVASNEKNILNLGVLPWLAKWGVPKPPLASGGSAGPACLLKGTKLFST